MIVKQAMLVGVDDSRSQLPNAASSEPKCNGPVGEGAKRPR